MRMYISFIVLRWTVPSRNEYLKMFKLHVYDLLDHADAQDKG